MSYNTPSDISNDFGKSAVQKAGMPVVKQIVYSIGGGAFISLGGLLAITVAGGMPEIAAANPGVTRFVFGAIFPVGLIMILIGGGQLFTSDCAVLPFGVLNKRVSMFSLVRVWTTVYLCNFIGALFIAYFFAYKAELITAEPWRSFVMKLGIAKTTAPFLKVFIKGIGANWLVCMAVWMSYAAKDVTGKIFAAWIPVMCFVALGMEHSIANMFFIPAAMLFGAEISTYDFIVTNLVPATLGNIVGGAVFVAMYYWFMFSSSTTTDKGELAGNNGQFRILKNLEKSLNSIFLMEQLPDSSNVSK